MGAGPAAYRRWFQLGQETGSDTNLTESLREAGQEPQRVLERAQSDETVRMLEAETNQARTLGIFGGPNFVVGGETVLGGRPPGGCCELAILRSVV